MTKKLSKSQGKKIIVTSLLMALLIFIRWESGKTITEDWDFMLRVLETIIAFLFIPLFFFILKMAGFDILKNK
jgi:hypothetical protein